MSLKRCWVLGIVLAGFISIATAQVNPKEKFSAVLKALQDNYVDDIDDEQMVDAAINAMLQNLDPHSKYFSGRESEQMRKSMHGSFVGVGIQFVKQNDTVCITQVISDGPADKCGLLSGDRILKLDKEPVSGVSMASIDIVNKMKGEKNSTVDFEILRQNKPTPVSVKVTRGDVPDKSVKATYMLTNKIGYISLGIFNETTRKEIDAALIQLKKEGMKDLILDLQGNGGGYVQAAIGAADEFLKKKQMVYCSIGKDRGKDYYYTAGLGQFMEGRLVVLIDQNTASASEILTGALQDWDRAVIVGRRSFGKGVMQRPVPLFDGSVLQLTMARYYTPSGRSLQKPYKNLNYHEEINNRFKTGEMFDESFIVKPDSLKYTTLINKRTVYGGGGIIPDLYVPIDTTKSNEWLQIVFNLGLVNMSSFGYVNDHREELKEKYSDIKKFVKKFVVPEQIINNIIDEADRSGIIMSAENKTNEINMLSLQIKAQIASQLFEGNSSYLQIINQDNQCLLKGIDVLERSSLYDQLLNKK
ncbi:S41 family peptidase [Labilibaculum euxinus]